MQVRRPAALAFVAVALSACNQTTSPPVAGSGAIPAAIRSSTGGECGAEITRLQAVLKSDVDTGNLGQTVYDRMTSDVNRASASCAAGRDGEALAQLSATKARYGYR